MIPDYFLQRLIEAGSKMRERQKAYFAGDPIKNLYVLESEIEFDEVLEKLKEMMEEQLKAKSK